MNIYFLIIIIIYALSVGLYMAKHGQRKEGNYNAFVAVITALIMITLIYLAINN